MNKDPQVLEYLCTNVKKEIDKLSESDLQKIIQDYRKAPLLQKVKRFIFPYENLEQYVQYSLAKARYSTMNGNGKRHSFFSHSKYFKSTKP